jgi:hypothetical protein
MLGPVFSIARSGSLRAMLSRSRPRLFVGVPPDDWAALAGAG